MKVTKTKEGRTFLLDLNMEHTGEMNQVDEFKEQPIGDRTE